MQSLKMLYKIGKGPSSSHTMGPQYAAEYINENYPDASFVKVILYGSLALTGEGHGTDKVLKETISAPNEIVLDIETKDLPHPNTLDFVVFDKDKNEIAKVRAMSIGGGEIRIEGVPAVTAPEVYPQKNFDEIKEYCLMHHLRLSDYVANYEGEAIFMFLKSVWEQMKMTVREGLAMEGILPGGLEVERKAKYLYAQRHMDETPETRENRLVCAYAYAASEQNAGGGTITTAPTCGASGVLPAVLFYMQEKKGFTDFEIAKALAAAGIVGNVVKQNASISGAEAGCQAEIGTACSMAAAALAELHFMDLDQIEYAAENAMEHYLGLTCDPVCGLVQIPCIERNAVAAMRAINALSLANFLTSTRKVKFDTVVETMYQTGKDLKHHYRETSEGGLAVNYQALD
ncbi:MAG: L-serine ammonia-lyase, iron-sulfur-dependent, subunit alpha [Acutalibacteraceae bacterium]|nr:L-serine ammonia-lyase, iron-sulfur-dependent, subunit alpha [Acutalibacteraceae bacterium]